MMVVLLLNRRILYQNENPRIWSLGTNWNIIYEVCVNRNMYVHKYVGSRSRITTYFSSRSTEFDVQDRELRFRGFTPGLS